ncbi:TetR/AcrR family transcriptional regulator [Clostridium vincentii]|uniref:HTH-type transcriptional repressor BepR n=1 Tax=Clostridium vincentii TaxID=52704 RepID=A0A2T0B8J4_9CLOT|nr:TetR/AcrR family transcriptional regulator [Clostridium vincentii]PRR80206.1 HTH-type transcriptional repressor BepR [Clostridium vincentii]
MESLKPKDKRKNINKKNIVDAAEKLFFTKGYNNSTMEQVAMEAGFTKRTLYSYFKSKEDIYEKIIQRGYEVLNKTFLDTLDEKKDSTELSKIKAMGYALINFETDFPGYYKSIFEYDGSETVPNELEETTIDILQKCVKEGIINGEITDRLDEVSISLILWASIVGFVNTFSRKQKYIKDYFNKDSREVIEKGLDLVLDSIKK